MRIKYLRDNKIAYDQIHVILEKEGAVRDVEDKLAAQLIKAGKAKLAEPTEKVTKAVKSNEYQNKSVKTYQNK